MKKNFIKFIILFLFLFVSAQVAFAFSAGSFGQIFGGKIINEKATEIQELEMSGYQCMVFGTTITIRSIKGPTTYIIPATVMPKSGGTGAGKWIMGKYSGKTMITCILESEPPETRTVDLDTITMFGTS